MFKRILIDGWALYVPIFSFVVFVVVFVAVSIRALRLGKAERERLAAMPLDQTSDNPR